MKIENNSNNIQFKAKFCTISEGMKQRIKAIRNTSGDKFNLKKFERDIPKIKLLADDSVTFSVDVRRVYKYEEPSSPYGRMKWPVLVAEKNLGSSKKIVNEIFLLSGDNVDLAKELLGRINPEDTALMVKNVVAQITKGMKGQS